MGFLKRLFGIGAAPFFRIEIAFARGVAGAQDFVAGRKIRHAQAAQHAHLGEALTGQQPNRGGRQQLCFL